MDFFDECLVRKRLEAEKAEYNSLETGMYAGEQLLTFCNKKLFEGRVSIYLPDSFIDMPLEWRRRKYPYENRPPVIFMDESGAVNLCLNLVSAKIGTLNEMLNGFMLVLKKMNPSNIFMDQDMLKAVNVDCALCEMRVQNLDGSSSCILFLSIVDHELLLGTFSCPNAVKNEWKKIVFEMIKSICEEGKNES